MTKKMQLPFEVPEHLKKAPAGIDELTRNLIESGEKEEHKLRHNGVTDAFFEYLDITDPELMDKPLSEKYAKRIYANAFKKIREAKKRNARARVNGGKAMQVKALTIQKLVVLLNTRESLSNSELLNAVKNYQDRSFSKTYLANNIKKHTNISHSVRTIRRILSTNKSVILISLAKATLQNPNSLSTEKPIF